MRKVDDKTLAVVGGDTTGTGQRKSMFAFNNVFDGSDSQVDVYTDAVADSVDAILDGNPVTIFAYGQTGSGKTHTILGDVGAPLPSGEMLLGTNTGVFFRLLSDLFAFGVRAAPRASISIRIAVLEIYMDKVLDLLAERKQLTVRSKSADEDEVVGLRWVDVPTMAAAHAAFTAGTGLRTVAATLMNPESSRSHAVFMFDVTVRYSAAAGAAPTASTTRVNLIDLAGSERIEKSGAVGEQMKEALAINKSLSTLGNVVNGLYQGTHVTYRDSMLTRLLKASFVSPAARILVVTNISPNPSSLTESLSSLRFADRVKSLKSTAACDVAAVAAEAAYLERLRASEEIAADIRLAWASCPTALPYCPLRQLPGTADADLTTRLRKAVEAAAAAATAEVDAVRRRVMDEVLSSAKLSPEARAAAARADELRRDIARLEAAAAEDAAAAEATAKSLADALAEARAWKRREADSRRGAATEVDSELADAAAALDTAMAELREKLTALGFSPAGGGGAFYDEWAKRRLPRANPVSDTAAAATTPPSPSSPHPGPAGRGLAVEVPGEGDDAWGGGGGDALLLSPRDAVSVPTGRAMRGALGETPKLDPAAAAAAAGGGDLTSDFAISKEEADAVTEAAGGAAGVEALVQSLLGSQMVPEGPADPSQVDAVLKALRAHPRVFRVVRVGLRMMGTMLEKDQRNRSDFSRKGACPTVLALLRGWGWNVDVATCAVVALLHLSRNSESNAEISAMRGIATIVGVMQTHSTSATLLSAANSALWSLATNRDNKKVIAVYHGVEAILGSMRAFPHEIELVTNANAALSSLAAIPENQALIAAKGGIVAVTDALRAHMSLEHCRLLTRGIAALCSLALRDDNKRLIADAGGVDLVLAAMRLFPMQAELLMRANAALCNLSATPPNTTRIARLGGIELILDSMRAFPANPDLLTSANVALSNLAVDTSNNAAIVAAGGLDLVCAALAAFPANPDLVVRGIATLSVLAMIREHKERILALRGIETICAAMRAFPDNPMLQSKSCAALWNMADNDDARRVILESDGRALVLKALNTFCTVDEVKREADGALTNIDRPIAPPSTSAGGLRAPTTPLQRAKSPIMGLFAKLRDKDKESRRRATGDDAVSVSASAVGYSSVPASPSGGGYAAPR